MVLITKLNRLCRFLKSILNNIDDIHRKDASLLSLDGVINTSNESHMANAIVNLLGTFTQLERDLIISRTKEDCERAWPTAKYSKGCMLNVIPGIVSYCLKKQKPLIKLSSSEFGLMITLPQYLRLEITL